MARLAGEEGSATDVVDAWVSSESGCGLAILGSYGQGKTSFARHLARNYANRYLADPTERMPILLRLGEVVHETQIEGLFGKEFTARHPTKGYQFRTLQHLNEAGRLLILLDGFDEMKHAMTAADFRANFAEFNRLLTGQAKILLLGRPNALPSDERELVMRGRARVADRLCKVQASLRGMRDAWRSSMSRSRNGCSPRRLGHCKRSNSRAARFQYSDTFVQARVAEIFRQVPLDLLERPVHVQLIAEVAADPGFDLRGFNTYKLYDHFIKTMVERDTVQKQARRHISLEARLTFQRQLAWWAWRRLGATQGCFFRHEVPSSLLSGLPDGNAADEEGKRNEYIVSTLTEEKDSGILYFAHRSFQEFLVAEHLRLTRPTPAAHADYSQFLTEDVIAFLHQAPSPDFIIDWYDTLRGASGPIAAGYLEFFASFPNLLDHMRMTTLAGEADNLDAWSVAIMFLSTRRSTLGALDGATVWSLLSQVVRRGQNHAAAVATLAMLGIYQTRLEPPMLAQMAGALIERCLRASRKDGNSSTLTIHKDEADFATQWMTDSVKRRFPGQGKTDAAALDFDLAALERACGANFIRKEQLVCRRIRSATPQCPGASLRCELRHNES